jgi:hypothetical protein
VTPTDPFDDLESRLRRRPVPALAPEFRERVLADMTTAAGPVPAGRWRFAAGLAAAVLVGLNLAGIAANDLFAGPVVPRLLPPPGASPRLASPWLPCDLPGRWG